MRLSRDGLTEISNYGMVDWFRDNFEVISDNFQEVIYTDQVSVSTNSVTSHTTPTNSKVQVGAIFQVSNNANNFITKGTVINVEYPAPAGVVNYNQTIITWDNPVDLINGDTLRFVHYDKGRITGGWDIHTKQYHLSLQTNSYSTSPVENTYATLAFDESVLGWTSFFTYKPNFIGSLKNRFYSTIDHSLYQHNYEIANNRNMFYGVSTSPSVTFIFNQQPDLSKNFLTVNYEGSSGWEVQSFLSDEQEPMNMYTFASNVTPNGQNIGDYSITSWSIKQDSTAEVLSLLAGQYDSNPAGIGYGTSAIYPPIKHAGFHVKENLYVANLVSNSQPRAGEVIFNTDTNRGYPMSGIKANYATVTMTVDGITDPNNMKELFAVSTTFTKSGF
jgi:hypothetical protein